MSFPEWFFTASYRALTKKDFDEALCIEGSDLKWRSDRRSRVAGKIAGSVNKCGYRNFSFNGFTTVLSHQAVWVMTHGNWPSMMIDHVDGDRLNNDPGNLRLVGLIHNSSNSVARNGRRYKGVTKLKSGMFQAQCAKKYIGCFVSEEAAAFAYDQFAKERYGEYARTNFV
jgi:hypothetical protein